MAETLLPIYASFQAADKAGQAVDQALPTDMNPVAKGAIEGGASGAVGGVSYGVAAGAQRLAGQAIAEGVAQMTAPIGYAAVATEGAAVAEGFGAAIVGAETGALLTSELGPIAIVGAALGAGVGLLASAFSNG